MADLESAREAFLDLIANASEFSEDVDGEYDAEGRAHCTVTYTLRFDHGVLNDLCDALGIPVCWDETPGDAVKRALDASMQDGPGSAGSGQLSEVL